jgi:hypothetical protein
MSRSARSPGPRRPPQMRCRFCRTPTDGGSAHDQCDRLAAQALELDRDDPRRAGALPGATETPPVPLLRQAPPLDQSRPAPSRVRGQGGGRLSGTVVTPYSEPLGFGRVLGDDGRWYSFGWSDCAGPPPTRSGARVAFTPRPAGSRSWWAVEVRVVTAGSEP